MYGSSRLGTYEPNQRLTPSVDSSKKWQLREGQKRYELTNHLGNVLVTINDRKQGFGFAAGAYTFFEAVVIQATDYFPFGLEMPGRTFQAANTTAYRFGFNDKENDRNGSWSGNQLVQDYGMRLYNPALAKFLSVDPIADEYPELTPYQFASNTPIQATDLDGLEVDFSKGKATKWEYSDNDKWYHKAGKFIGNTGVSVWNGAVNMAETGTNHNVFAYIIDGKNIITKSTNEGIDNAKAVVKWVKKPSNEKVNDVKELATNPHTYEDLLALVAARKLSKLASKKPNPSTKGLGDFQGKALTAEEAFKVTGGQVPIPPKGKGSVAPVNRDPKRLFPKKEIEQQLQNQSGKCAHCDQPKNIDEVKGHHEVRHADGGPTTPSNLKAVCSDCHKIIHQ